MPGSEPKVRRDSRLFTQLCSTLLGNGHAVRFRAIGESMRPNLLHGDDVLVAPAQANALRRGDVVLAENANGLVLHRLASLDSANGNPILRSDTAEQCDPPTRQIFGKVRSLRRGAKEQSLTPLQTRLIHPLRTQFYRLSAAAKLRLRRLAPILSSILPTVLLCAAALALVPSLHAQTADLQLTQTPSSTAVATNAFTQSLGTATTVTWSGGTASFTFPTPLPSGVFPNVLLTTSGFTPAAYNVTNASITSVNTATGVVTIALANQSLGTATAASWAANVASFTFPTPLPSDAVVGAQLTTTGFVPAAFNVTNATIASVNVATGVITVALPSQSMGTATTATWAANVASFTFPTPLPAEAVVGARLTTTGFTPSAYNVTNAAITSVNGATGVVTVALNTQSTGTATAGTWAANVASFTFPTPLPSEVVVGDLLTTAGFTPTSYNVTNATITSVAGGVITVALAGNQSVGTATNATWAGNVASFTFPTPLPPDAVVGDLITTSGFTPSSYNVTNATITSVSGGGVVTVALPTQSLGTATSASWAGGVISYTFSSSPSFAVVGDRITTAGFNPGGYNVTNAAITSVIGNTITVAHGGALGVETILGTGTLSPSAAASVFGTGTSNPSATASADGTGTASPSLTATADGTGNVAPSSPATTRGTGTVAPSTSTANGTGTVPAGYSYTELVTNNSSSAQVTSGTVTVYMQTPADTIFESATGTNWSCTNPTVGGVGPVICTYNSALNSGAQASPLVFGFQVVSGTAAGTTIQSSATVTNSTFVDTAPTNNTSVDSIVVEPPTTSDLALAMSVSPTPVFVSSNFNYNITIQNLGQASAPITSGVLSDTLPAGVTFVSYTASSTDSSVWTCSGTSTISCSITANPMTTGAVANITITVSAPVGATTLSNTATVSLPGDPNSTNNSATAYTVVQPLACATPGRDGVGGTLTGVINSYYPPMAAGTLPSASTSVVLGAVKGASKAIAAGDLLLIIQTQAATINSTNTSSYGDGLPGDPGSGATSLGSSGLFEFITATNSVPVTGGTLTFSATGPTGGLLNSYSLVAASSAGTTYVPQQTYQIIRVPQYSSATFSSSLVPLAWNGSLGGVLVVDVSSQLTLGGTVALDALGFRGGGAQLLTGPSIGGTNTPTDYVTGAPTNATTTTGANSSKGEGIAGTPRYVAPATITTASNPTDAYGGTLTDSLPGGSYARGAPGNAGGGGTDGDPPINDQNSGGGAGGNGGSGGQGGYGWNSMAATNTTDGGFGGAAFPASTSALVMGGGGGGGTTNNGTYCNYNSGTGTCTVSGSSTGIYSSGGAGAGIIIVHAGSVTGSGTITANGQSTLSTLNDSTGGGGAGGSILVFANSGGLSGLTVNAIGGNGGEAWPIQTPGGFPGQRHGPGGGGGGGVIFLSAAPASSNVSGGSNGFTNTVQDSYGSTPGRSGVAVTTHVITETPGTQSGAYCGSADLSVTNSANPIVVLAGGAIAYTQTVSNAGPLDAVNPVFSESVPSNSTFQSITYPAGWSCVTPAVGGTGTITCTAPLLAATGTGTFTVGVQVSATAAYGTEIVDVDNVTSGTSDPNLTNNSATAITTVAVANQADLAVTNLSSAPTVTVGSNFTMTATVTNNGPLAASALVFTEPMASDSTATYTAALVSFSAPGWVCSGTTTLTCTLASLSSGASSTIAITETAPTAPAGTVLLGTANIASSTPDPNYGNNSSTASITEATAGQADLAISASGMPNPVTAGNNITYAQSVTNNGPTAITISGSTSVTFTDTIPANTTLASTFSAPSGWTCNTIAVGATGTFTCTLNSGQTLAVGASVNFPLVVKVNAGTAPGTTIGNSPSIASSVSDPNLANNTATVNTTVASPSQAFVSIVKTASPEPVNQGTNLAYTILVTNNGPAVAQGVTVTDPIPTQLTYASSTASQGTCTYSSGTTTVNCNLGSLAVGSVAVVSINATASVFGSGAVSCNGVTLTYTTCNTATLSTTTSNPNPVTSSSAASTIQAPTAVDLASFNAIQQADGTVRLVWHTLEESRNLGFHIYREDPSGRRRINPSLIAGSALMLRASRPQHAAKSYAWVDAQPSANASYWLEDVDINGTRTLHGPVYAELASSGNSLRDAAQSIGSIAPSPSLAQLRAAPAAANSLARRPMIPRLGRPEPTPTPAVPLFNVADHLAVKISVDQEGWVHIPFAQLFSAGLDPYTDVRLLHLYAEGVEQPLLLTGRSFGFPAPTDGLEFYGTGIDTPFSGTRVYWLLAENSFSKRVTAVSGGSPAGVAPGSFPFTVIREDRTIYFAALLNGENNDNFFGDIVTSTPVDELLTVVHRDTSSSQPLTLDLALQGVTDQQLHSVSVQFNGTNVGTYESYGETLVTQSFSVDPSLLLDGANTITLTALNGDNDVSLVQSVQLHYLHTYAADSDWLRATASAGSPIQVSGFTSPQVRLFDITDPLNILELNGQVSAHSGTYSIAAEVPQGAPYTRTILAVAQDALSAPSSLSLHTPAFPQNQRAGADIVVITHPDFASHLDPLVRLHTSQGYKVLQVTTDELFDQFNYGERSPFALRTFLQNAATQWQRKPQAVLLVGDASMDPRNYLGFGDFDFVPTRIIETAAFKTASDDWLTDFQQNGYPTIPTGRLPVRTTADLDALISKIVGYEQGLSAGPWNSQALLIADRNVDGNFSSAINAAAATLPNSLQVSQILTDGMDPATARGQVLNALNNGALIVDYNGHGAEQQWSFSDLFDGNDAAALTNGGRLPVYLLIDCLNGLFQDVYAESLAKSLILAPNGGAVAVWASSGFTEQSPQASMDLALLHEMSLHPNEIVGLMVLRAKSGTSDNDVRRTWIFFGDPAMRLHFTSAVSGGPNPRPISNPPGTNNPSRGCPRGLSCTTENQQ